MARVREYYRPETVAEALGLLARPGVVSAPLAGGTTLVPRLLATGNEVQAVVDLGRLGLDFIKLDEGVLHLGATVTLADVTEDKVCHRVAGGLLSRAARLNAEVNVRNAATVGGVVAEMSPTSELLLVMLALDAELVIQSASDSRSVPLDIFVQEPAGTLAGDPSIGSEHRLLTEVRFAVPEGHVGVGLARVGRTPHDRPIVAAAAVVTRQGDVAARVGLSMSGIAATPVRLKDVEETLAGRSLTNEVLEGAVGGLETRLIPPDDFRGSATYRRAMAPVLARRALLEAWAMTSRSP